MKETKRYVYIDLIKAIGILFVCMCHFWYFDVPLESPLTFRSGMTYFSMTLFSTCVPLFFVASGAMLLNKPLDEKKHYRKLGIMAAQFFLWRIITVCALGAVQRIDFGVFPKLELINIFVLLRWPELVRINHLWFIPAFICVLLMHPFIKTRFDPENEAVHNRYVMTVSVGILFFLTFVLHDLNVFKNLFRLTTRVDTSGISTYFDPFAVNIGTMLLYFIFGGYLQKYRERIVKIPTVICILAIPVSMAMAFAGGIIMSKHTGEIYDVVFNGYGSIPTLISTAAIFILAAKAEFLLNKSQRIVSFIHMIGRSTLSIYYLHWILGYAVCEWVFHVFSDVLPFVVFPNLLMGSALVLSSVLIGRLLRKIPVIGKYLL